MISAWRADIKDTLPADTTNVFCSSEKWAKNKMGKKCKKVAYILMVFKGTSIEKTKWAKLSNWF
jgi:hypothetical protein